MVPCALLRTTDNGLSAVCLVTDMAQTHDRRSLVLATPLSFRPDEVTSFDASISTIKNCSHENQLKTRWHTGPAQEYHREKNLYPIYGQLWAVQYVFTYFFYGSYLYLEDMHNTIKNISQMYQFGISEAHK